MGHFGRKKRYNAWRKLGRFYLERPCGIISLWVVIESVGTTSSGGSGNMRNLKEMEIGELKQEIDALALVEKCEVFTNTPVAPEQRALVPEYKAIRNMKTGAIETIASNRYTIIQHKDAFGAVLDALVAVSNGSKFSARVVEQGGRAWMTVVFTGISADDGANGIELGINVRNSHDKSSSLRYSGTQSKGVFEFFGYRRVCSNGMTIRIPLAELGDLNKVQVKGKAAKKGEIVAIKPELVGKVEGAVRTSIRHVGKDVDVHLERLNQMFLSLPAVAKHLEARIKAVKKISFTAKEADERLEEIGMSDRVRKRVLELYQREEQNAWGLYNAMTAHATHDASVKPSRMDWLLGKATGLLEVKAKVSE